MLWDYGRYTETANRISITAQSALGSTVVRGDFRVFTLLLLSSSDTTCISLPRNRMSGILHVRICGGAGRQLLALPGSLGVPVYQETWRHLLLLLGG